MDFAAELVEYYSSGGLKPISSILDSRVTDALAKLFGMTTDAFKALTTQRQVYEFLKAFWTRPDDDSYTCL